MIVCNIQLQNKKDSFIKKSYSIPVGIFPGNKATIDDKGNIYVATGMLGVVQKFNKNGDFIKSILIEDDIDFFSGWFDVVFLCFQHYYDYQCHAHKKTWYDTCHEHICDGCACDGGIYNEGDTWRDDNGNGA